MSEESSLTPPAPTPRVPRAEVRRRLLEAAAREFAGRGYADTRLDDVARAAGFTKGAVYSNFGNKQELFAELIGSYAAEKLAAIRASLSRENDPGVARARAAAVLTECIVDDERDHQLILEFSAQAGRDPAIRAAWAPRWKEIQAAAADLGAEETRRLGLRLTVDVEVLARILLALRNGLVLERAIVPENATAAAIEQAVAGVLAGMVVQDGPPAAAQADQDAGPAAAEPAGTEPADTGPAGAEPAGAAPADGAPSG